MPAETTKDGRARKAWAGVKVINGLDRWFPRLGRYWIEADIPAEGYTSAPEAVEAAKRHRDARSCMSADSQTTIADLDNQVTQAARELSDEQKRQPDWLWYANIRTSFGRWHADSSQAPYVRLDIALAEIERLQSQIVALNKGITRIDRKHKKWRGARVAAVKVINVCNVEDQR